MRNLGRARCLLYLLVFLPGCQVFYRYRPVAVLVLDAETQKPIEKASIHISYPLTRDSLAPYECTEQTGADGIAHLRAVPYGDFGVRVEASAAGYMSEERSLSKEAIQRIEPPHPFEATRQQPPTLAIEMYAEPRFVVELVVPVGYRGLIHCETRIQEEAAAPPGQRCFPFEVIDGFVQVYGPGVLQRVYPSDYRARYADGTPLSGEMTFAKVGFRWLRSAGNDQYFLVGTQSEYDIQRRSHPDEQSSTPRRSSGGGGGKHGHGRHQ